MAGCTSCDYGRESSRSDCIGNVVYCKKKGRQVIPELFTRCHLHSSLKKPGKASVKGANPVKKVSKVPVEKVPVSQWVNSEIADCLLAAEVDTLRATVRVLRDRNVVLVMALRKARAASAQATHSVDVALAGRE